MTLPTTPSFRLDGKRALVAGASSGIGFETALEFSLDSKNKIVCIARSADKLRKLLEIAKGINPSRLSGRGYGESQLVNECSNGVQCSEEQHQLNRRSEFIVLSNN